MTESCSRCEFFDGDAYCTLPRERRKLAGYIHEPASVVCDQFEPHHAVCGHTYGHEVPCPQCAPELSRLGGNY